MTTNDKTGEKLVDSMRKTKAAVAADKPDASQTEAKESQAEKPAPPVKRKTTTKRSPDKTQGGDPYQSGRRIWPD